MSRISIRGISIAVAAVATTAGVVGFTAAPTNGGVAEADAVAPLRADLPEVATFVPGGATFVPGGAADLPIAPKPTRVARPAPTPTPKHTVAPKPKPTPTPTATRTASASRSTQRQPVYSGDPRAIARQMVAARGWSSTQFGCLDQLWTRESDWRVNAYNASSGAYGIPQALPGTRMASAGSDWRTNPRTQITWGLGYIADSYGDPCGAWAHSQRTGWY